MSKKAVIEKPSPAAPASDTPAPPVYFLSVSVKNFRCFGEKQKLNLSDGNGNPKFWTIILGDNGVGKTTLLQVLAALQPVKQRSSTSQETDNLFLPALATHRNTYGFADEIFLNPRSQSGHITLRVCGGNVDGANFSQPIEMKAYASYNSLANIISQGSSAKRSGVQVPHLTMQGSDEELNVLIVCGYGASRRPGLPAIREEQNQDNCASLFEADAELINPVEGLLQADYAASKGHERAQKRLQTIKDVFIGLLPDVEDFKFEPLNNETDLPTAQAKTPYGWVPVRSLSLGYQSMMTWTLDLASRLFTRYPDSPNPLAEPAVVLVDEIDLHLHPRWQRTLIQFLTDTFPKTQFIVTAHSPLVVQAAPDANIVVLRREGDHVVIDNDVKVVEGWRADQILTSDLFGLSSARPPHMDGLLNERDQILSKSKLTNADEERLKALESQIGDLPTGETPADMEAMDIIRRAAANMKARVGNAK